MTNQFRRTKIVCTLGPSTDKDNNLEKIIKAGANVVRLNFSHGNPEEHIRRANEVKKVANKLGKIVAILGDLQGPKIRISTFKNGKIILKENNTFILDANLPKEKGDEISVGIDYKELPNDLKVDDILLLDDGKVRLQVIKIENLKIYTKVIIGGILSNNKGINKLHGGLSAKSITDKDKNDILLAAKIDVDYLAVSFPRSAEDINYARSLAQKAGLNAKIVAKIERAETIANDEIMESIILASDVIMVARGDLGVEIEYPNLVLIQKKLIFRTRELNRIAITATQMMESMIDNPTPTRAEVMDVANAVLDGTDAVMLSAETSVGKYPEETVKSMVEICLGAETMPKINISSHRLSFTFDNIEEMTAMSAMYSANHLDGVKGVIGLTTSGNTVRYMSRISSPLPIYGVSRHEKTLRLMTLYRGVLPIHWGAIKKEGQEDPYDCYKCINHLKKMDLLENDNLVILTHGINTIINNKAIEEKSNTCMIIRVQ